MRKHLAITLSLLALLGLFLGCAATRTPSPHTETDFDTTGSVALTLQQDSIGLETQDIFYYVENRSDETISFGVEFSVEAYRDGAWVQVPFSEDAAWISIAVMLAPGEQYAGQASLSMLKDALSLGRYRLIKSVGGRLCYAVFTVEEDAQANEAYAPLETLPLLYTREMAVENGDVVFAAGSEYNTERIDRFLNDVVLGLPAMLRIVRYTVEGDPVICDIQYEKGDGNGCFLYRTDVSRDTHGGSGITACYRSYLITDGKSVYLSNCASFASTAQYSTASNLWLFDGYTASVTSMMQNRLVANSTRYRVYDRTGSWCVQLEEDPLCFGYSSQSFGAQEMLSDPQDSATRIRDAAWIDTDRFVLVCETSGETRYFAAFSVVNGTLSSIGYGRGFDASGEEILCLA